jgi:hypothetical protein
LQRGVEYAQIPNPSAGAAEADQLRVVYLDASDLALPAVDVRQPAVAQDHVAEGKTGRVLGREGHPTQL